VLGDELCAGTESISALSIFAASVKKLSKMRANFVFATHLHELSKMECITSLENVCMYHLKVIFDENSGKLIYDRKLTEGSGNSIYGLEVCKSMDMDQDFLEDANNIRQEIMGLKSTILEYKPSKYNSKLMVDNCEICQKEAEDTHHIKFQNTANENNIIDGYIQKDTKSNLVPLCKECHVKVHNNSLVIHGYIETNAGRKLEYEHINEKQKKSNKKYDDIQLEIIKEFIEKNNKVNNKTVCVMLNNKHQIKISCSTLGKIKNNSY
jgi:DNA mismatch repair protein MutS